MIQLLGLKKPFYNDRPSMTLVCREVIFALRLTKSSEINFILPPCQIALVGTVSPYNTKNTLQHILECTVREE